MPKDKDATKDPAAEQAKLDAEDQADVDAFVEAREKQNEGQEPGTPDSTEAVNREGDVTTDDNDALKRDDEGAIEQQKAADDAPIEEPENVQNLLGTPVLEEGGSGTLRIVSHLQRDHLDAKDATEANWREVDEGSLGDLNLWLEGEGFPRGEVTIDVAKLGQEGSPVRYAAWVDDDKGGFSMQLAALNAPGEWEVVAYTTVTTVGENDREDRRRQMFECDRRRFTVRS